MGNEREAIAVQQADQAVALRRVTPLACASVAPLLARGLSAPLDEPEEAVKELVGARAIPWLPVLVGVAVSIPLVVLSVFLAGGGHGVYAPMIVCFPYSMLLAELNGSIAKLHIALAFAQYPLYGALIGVSRRQRGAWRLWLGLAAVHLGVVTIAVLISMKQRTFWP